MYTLDDIRHDMAEYMRQHARGSLDSALFYTVKIAYQRGYKDGLTAKSDNSVVSEQQSG